MNNIKNISKPKPFTGRKFLICILGFFFTVISVNLLMAYYAVETFPGVVTDDAYVKGRSYNETLAEAEVQASLGWQAEFKTEKIAEREYGLLLYVTNQDGRVLKGLEVQAELRRPARADMDQKTKLLQGADGKYRANIKLPLEGRWIVMFTARRGDQIFRLNDEFMTTAEDQ